VSSQVVALGLLGAATTMVDIMMLYVLPQKDKYGGAKNEEVKVMQDVSVQREGRSSSVGVSDEGLKSSLLEESK
jgi:hypothetical protein